MTVFCDFLKSFSDVAFSQDKFRQKSKKLFQKNFIWIGLYYLKLIIVYISLSFRLSVKLYELSSPSSSDDETILQQRQYPDDIDLSDVYDGTGISHIDSSVYMAMPGTSGYIASENTSEYHTSLSGMIVDDGVQDVELITAPKRNKRGRPIHKRIGRFLRKRLLCCVRPNTVEIL